MSTAPKRNANETYPVKPGDWVVSKFDPAKVAKVKSVYRIDAEGFAEKCFVDLVLYSRSGNVIGRASPALNGPRKFEPAMEYDDWVRIDNPRFPIEIVAVPDPKKPGTSTMIYATRGIRLPDRKWVKPERKPKLPMAFVAPDVDAPKSDFAPEMEAAARRMAAQELRDSHKQGDLERLLKRADELEREADILCPRK